MSEAIADADRLLALSRQGFSTKAAFLLQNGTLVST